MAAEYKIHFLSAAGALLYALVDYQSFHLVREVNKVGELAITLRGDHPALSVLEHKSLVEVWRRDRAHGLAWTCEARYLYLYYQHSTKEIGQVVIKCVDPLWWLSTRIVAWDVDVANRSKFFRAASVIINTLVSYNCCSLATVANGRLRDGNIPQVIIQSNDYVTPDIGWECAYENVLANLQKLQPIGGGDLSMTYQGSGVWQFAWMTGQLGTDRSATHTFSIELDNMVDPVQVLDRRAEKTVAIVGGQIVRGDRDYYIRVSVDYLATTNNIEMWVPAPGVLDVESMKAAADSALMANRKIDRLTFNIINTPSYFYGVDYFLGDKVTTIYQGVSKVLEIKKVTIDAAPTGENSLVLSCG